MPFIAYCGEWDPPTTKPKYIDTSIDIVCDAKDNVILLGKISNSLDKEVHLSPKGFGLYGKLENDTYKVKSEDEGEISYVGVISESKYNKSNFYKLKPNDSVIYLINLSEYYDFSSVKKATIYYESMASNYYIDNVIYLLSNKVVYNKNSCNQVKL